MKRKFRLIVLVILMLAAQPVTARNLQPLIESIALLQLYIGYVQKGYDIAQKGLQTVRDIKNGEFNIHDDYFNSLKRVNPNLKQYSKVAAILKTQASITTLYNKGRKTISRTGQFDADESGYLIRVYNNLIDDCSKEMDELELVITDGKLEMKDDERMKRIDLIYERTRDRYSFISSFNKQVSVVAVSRKNEQQDISRLRRFYNL